MRITGTREPWFPCESAHPVSGNTRINCRLPWVQKLLHDCQRNHVRCQPPDSPTIEPPAMPSRLIDVTPLDESRSVKVVESIGLREPYLCLSHCWGVSSVPLSTTNLNLHNYLHRIEWSSLPKTFQDAIDFVRLLEQRYLWIDSLCIVQDDPNDWERNSIQMASIYQNAYLTLAATKARSSEEGLYNAANKFDAIPLSALAKNGRIQSVLCRRAVHHWYQGEHSPGSMTRWLFAPVFVSKHFPLLDRAWVLQERLLSPRILHFGPAELLWECCERFTCECRDAIDDRAAESYPKVQHSQSLSTASSITAPAMWRNIVQIYTHLGITYPKDRLPALQGIASQLFQDETASKVLSGLWEETLVLDLLWRSKYHPSESRMGSQRHAPSWSWASMESGVYYDLDTTSATEHASIQGFQVEKVQHDNRTIVAARSIDVSALVLPGKVFYGTSDNTPDATSDDTSDRARLFDRTAALLFDHACQLAPTKTIDGLVHKEFYPDWNYSKQGKYHIPLGTMLYGVLIATIYSTTEIREWGLVIKHSDNGRRKFERVGCFFRAHPVKEPYDSHEPRKPADGPVVSLQEMFSGAERTTVTLV